MFNMVKYKFWEDFFFPQEADLKIIKEATPKILCLGFFF